MYLPDFSRVKKAKGNRNQNDDDDDDDEKKNTFHRKFSCTIHTERKKNIEVKANEIYL